MDMYMEEEMLMRAYILVPRFVPVGGLRLNPAAGTPSLDRGGKKA